MIQSVYRFADINVSISSIYDEIHIMCADYKITEDASVDINIATTEEDIDYESKVSEEERLFEGLDKCSFPRPYLETLAIYRKMASLLPDYGVFLFHGSVVAVDGEGYLFTAASGTGKSTHAKLWREYFGEKSVMVNDDKPLIRLIDKDCFLPLQSPIVYGTPWDGKHHLSSNISVPLKSICILERGENNTIEKISTDEAYMMLLQQAFRPKEPDMMVKVMQMLVELSGRVGLYRLKCNMHPDAAKVSYEGMQDK